MFITQKETKIEKEVHITLLENIDVKKITKTRYFFDWKQASKNCLVYKLSLAESEDILGLIGLIEIPSENRIEIALICVSKENKGRSKKYDGIAGCLIAFACRMALENFGFDACVSLIPKTELKSHYINKYKMKDGGWQIYLDGKLLKETTIKYYI